MSLVLFSRALLLVLFVLTRTTCTASKVVFGNEVLRDNNYDLLKGKRIAILTNPTGVFTDEMKHIVDCTYENPLLDVVAVFSPEHGFRGAMQAETGDPLMYTDNTTGLPVFSAYNMTVPEISLVLRDLRISAVLIDMQDVGVRLYTFIWTMYDIMNAVASIKEDQCIQVVITDRPNPLGGNLVDGPTVNMSCCASGYGKFPITFLHGMTIGELGLMFNSALRIPPDSLNIVKMIGWHRYMTWNDIDEASLRFPPWVPPSPNIPTAQTCFAYGATVFLEATTVAEGRGTTTPFELFGAPFIDAEDTARMLNRRFQCPREASAFRAAYFEPVWSKYNNTVVPGVQWITRRTMLFLRDGPNKPSIVANDQPYVSPFAAGVQVLCAMRDLSTPADAFQWDGSWFGHPGTELIDSYAGTPLLREQVDAGWSADRIVAYYRNPSSHSGLHTFLQARSKVLLYK